MGKGRHTTVIAIRIPDDWYELIDEYARKRGVTKQDWLKPIVHQALRITKRLKE